VSWVTLTLTYSKSGVLGSSCFSPFLVVASNKLSTLGTSFIVPIDSLIMYLLMIANMFSSLSFLSQPYLRCEEEEECEVLYETKSVSGI